VNLRKDHSHECFPTTLHVHHLCEGLNWLAIASTASCVRLVAGGVAQSCGHCSAPAGTVTFNSVTLFSETLKVLQLSAMDASARTTMKGAAKCDKHCELQNSVNQ
jgi:hypothetical protein